MRTTAVVTGIGVAAPNGLGAGDFWRNTLAGRSGIRPMERFDAASYPSRLAGQVPGFDDAARIPSRLLPQTDRMTRLALVTAEEALADAGVEPAALPEYGMGVVTASGSGGFEFGQRELQKLWSRGPEYVSAYQSFAWFYAVNTGQISIRHGMRGPSGVLVTEQAGGLDAAGQARRLLRRGTSLVLTGGVDASLCPWGWVAQMSTGRISTAADPGAAYLPFDRRAAGYVPGEGGALLIAEDREAALARGARQVYGTIAGYAATFDPRPAAEPGAPPGTPPGGAHCPRGIGLQRAIELALRDAGLRPDDIGAVFADAAGVPAGDLAESAAITGAFGRRGVLVTAPKTMTGRLSSGGAALDLAAAFLALRDGVLPPTANVADLADGCDLDLVLDEPREVPLRAVLVLARGPGGFNAAMVLSGGLE